jgi:hypothetical protein
MIWRNVKVSENRTLIPGLESHGCEPSHIASVFSYKGMVGRQEVVGQDRQRKRLLDWRGDLLLTKGECMTIAHDPEYGRRGEACIE